MRTYRVLGLCLLVLVCAPAHSAAEEDTEEVSALKARLRSLELDVKQLQGQLAEANKRSGDFIAQSRQLAAASEAISVLRWQLEREQVAYAEDMCRIWNLGFITRAEPSVRGTVEFVNLEQQWAKKQDGGHASRRSSAR